MAERWHPDLKRLGDEHHSGRARLVAHDRDRRLTGGVAQGARCGLILRVEMEDDQAAVDRVMAQAADRSISNSRISADL